MFKKITLLFIIMLYVLLYTIIDFFKINTATDIHFIYFIMMFILMYSYIHLRFNITKMYRVITPFFLYSFFFWWIPFYLLFNFSTYRVSPLIYDISLLSFTSIIFFYELFTLFIPNIDEFKFKKRLTYAEKSYQLKKNFYNDFWKICFFFSFFFTTLFFIKAGYIPMFANNPELARVAAMKGSGTIQRFSYLTLHFGVISYFIVLYITKRKVSIFVIFTIIFLVFYNMLTGPRSYALWALVFIYIAYQTLHFKKLKIMHGLIFLSTILLIVAIVGGIRYSGLAEANMEDTVIRFINRIYMNPVNADRIVNFFNTPIPTNSFIIELSVLLPGYQPDLGTYLKDLMGIKFDGGGITVPLPAEGYMNFGYIGVIIYSLFYVIILKTFELYIYTRKTTIFTIMFMIIIPVQFMGMITMGISGIIVKTTIPVIIVFLVMLSFTKLFQLVRKKKYVQHS